MRNINACQNFTTNGRVGDNLGKMAKNCMKITKLTFLGQNSGGGHGGDKPIFQVVGGIPPTPPPTRGNPEWSIGSTFRIGYLKPLQNQKMYFK